MTNNNAHIVKFTYQRCFEYNPAINKSRWVMEADFSDGSHRRWSGYLGENDMSYLLNMDHWKEVAPCAP